MAQCVEIPVNVLPPQPVITGCVSPTGIVGETICVGMQPHVCGNGGEWIPQENQVCVGEYVIETKYIVLGAAAVIALALISGGRRGRNNYDDWEY